MVEDCLSPMQESAHQLSQNPKFEKSQNYYRNSLCSSAGAAVFLDIRAVWQPDRWSYPLPDGVYDPAGTGEAICGGGGVYSALAAYPLRI